MTKKRFTSIIIKDIQRAKGKPSDPNIYFVDVATSLLVRDYKGMSNWANAVLEIEENNQSNE
jgi:hypothetical protein